LRAAAAHQTRSKIAAMIRPAGAEFTTFHWVGGR
jgi:hypothetical protein